MNKKTSFTDRINHLMTFYELNSNEMAKQVGGSRTKIYNAINGKTTPGFETLEAILETFPDVSAEWLMRGQGEMLKSGMISLSEVETIVMENKAIKALYKSEVLGKPNGASQHLQVDREGASDLLSRSINRTPYTNGMSMLLNPFHFRGFN